MAADVPQAPPVPPQPSIRLDPVRATESAGFGSEHEFMLVLRRHVVNDTGGNYTVETVPCASIAMTWHVAKQIRDLLNKQIDEYETKQLAAAQKRLN